jgi:hypothetical protein
MTRFPGSFVLFLTLWSLFVGCSSGGSDGPKPDPDASSLSADCQGEGEPIRAGFTKAGAAGLTFEVTELTPAEPVQTTKAPGNTWSIAVKNSEGAPASGTLLVSASMPLHNNHPVSGPVAVDAGLGLYEIHDLLLPMPGLYSIALSFVPSEGPRDSVVLMLCMSVQSG